MTKGFDRRIFTARLYLSDLFYLASKVPTILGSMRNKEISRAFLEKIFLVVTAVNGCAYCTWFHAKTAISSGIGAEELKKMLNLQFHADADDFEMVALLYAQHYAETNRQPDPEMNKRLVGYYGPKTAQHIAANIRVIFFGNLVGNTFDAFISRLKGLKAPDSNAVFETIFFILHAPFLLPVLPFTKKHRQ